MRKNFLSIIILLLVVIIVAINIAKPGFSINNEVSKKTKQEDDSATTRDIPGIDFTTSLEKGEKAPDFELTTLSGKRAKLSDFRGSTVILNFWATWCPPCKAEMPSMESFYKKHKGKNITIVSVNLTNIDNGIDEIQAFAKEYSLTFNILLDKKGNVGNAYQAFTIPTSYIIDKNGVISNKIIGPMDEEMMGKLTKDL